MIYNVDWPYCNSSVILILDVYIKPKHWDLDLLGSFVFLFPLSCLSDPDTVGQLYVELHWCGMKGCGHAGTWYDTLTCNGLHIKDAANCLQPALDYWWGCICMWYDKCPHLPPPIACFWWCNLIGWWQDNKIETLTVGTFINSKYLFFILSKIDFGGIFQ